MNFIEFKTSNLQNHECTFLKFTTLRITKPKIGITENARNYNILTILSFIASFSFFIFTLYYIKREKNRKT